MSTVQAALDEFDATPEPDGDTRTCPFCEGTIPNVKLPKHLADDCEAAPRGVHQ